MGRYRIHTGNLLGLSLGVLALLGTIQTGLAVEIQAGRVYPGGSRLEIAAYGVAFTVPAHWKGALPGGSEVFVMQPDADPQVYILASGEAATRAEVAKLMASPIDLGDGLTLHPSTGLVERGEALAGRYEVRGGARPLSAYSEALSGAHGVSVAFTLIAAPGSLAQHEAVVRTLIDGTDLGAGDATVSGSAPAGAGDAQERWDVYLKGKHILRYYTAPGYTEEQYLWLCSDGTFLKGRKSGGFGGGASGAYQGKVSGRWAATGAGEHGRLTLRYDDGTESGHDLRWDYDKNRLYVDGKRWLHGTNDLCN